MLFLLVTISATSQRIVITVTLTGTPSDTTHLTPANLKYNKWARFGITVDDQQKTALNLHAYYSGGTAVENGVTYAGHTFSDGANVRGKNIKWRASIAANAFWNADTTQTAWGLTSGNLTTSDMQLLLNDGWDLLDHGAFHGIDQAGAKALGLNPLKNAALNRDFQYRTLGYITRFGVVPSADANYHSAWEQLGYLGGSSESVDDGYPGTVPAWWNMGTVDVTNWKSDNRYKVHLRRFKDLSGISPYGDATNFLDGVTYLCNHASATTNLSLEHGMHNAYMDTTIYAIDSFAKMTGDHIWICGLQEFYEYFQVIQQTAVKQSLSGNVLTVTLDQSFLPDETRWRDMSFLLSSNVGISSVTVSGADDYSYNTSTGLINIYKKKTSGFLPPPSYTGTGFVFHSKIPLTKYNIFIDNNYDNPPSALIDGDTTTLYRARDYNGALIYTPFDLSFNLSDYGVIVDSVRVRTANEVGYTTKVILTRNDNEAEDSIGVFTGASQNQWLTFVPQDTASKKFVASRLILRSDLSAGYGSEVEVYGDYLPYTEQTFKHRGTPLKYMLGSNGHWWNLTNNVSGMDNQSVFSSVKDSLHLYSFRNYGEAESYQDSTGAHWYFDPVRRGWREDQMWRHMKADNPEAIRFSTIIRQTLAVQKMWDQADSSWQLKAVVDSVKEYGGYSSIYVHCTQILAGVAGSVADHIKIAPLTGSGRIVNSDDWHTLELNTKTLNTEANAGYVAGDQLIIYKRHSSDLNIAYPQGISIAGRQLPQTYDSAARMAFVWTSRKGRNTGAPHFNPALEPSYAPNNDSVGLNTAEWVEVMNEPTASWSGFDQFLNGNNLGLAWSKIYDNNKVYSTALGAKNADTSMKVSTSGLAVAAPDVMYGSEFWVRKNRGNRPKQDVPTQPLTWKAKTFGWADNPYDVLQFHMYSYTGGSNQYAGNTQSGLPVELGYALGSIDGFVRYRDKYAPWAGVDIGEWGYDRAQRSPMNAPFIDTHSNEQVQAAWAVRSMLVFNAHGIDYAQWYRLFQDEAGDDTTYGYIQFATMSLLRDATGDGSQISTRIVGRYFGQLSEFGDYVYDSTLREDSIYCYRFKKDTNYLYAVWSVESSPNQDNWKTEKAVFHERTGTFDLPLGNKTEIRIRKFQDNSCKMTSSSEMVKGHFYRVKYGLVPVLIQVNK